MTTIHRVFNFAAGPAVLPLAVLERIQRDMLALPGVGISILEISHRSKEFEAMTRNFDVREGPAAPAKRGEISAYFDGKWHALRARSATGAADPIRSLDVSVLQDQLLAPVLGIADVTTDKPVSYTHLTLPTN